MGLFGQHKFRHDSNPTQRTHLLAVFKDLNLVLLAGGLVVEVGGPLSFGVHELVVEEPAELVALLLRADHGHHRLVTLLLLVGLVPILK